MPTLNVFGTPFDEKTGETTKKAIIRQKTSKKTGKLCCNISISNQPNRHICINCREYYTCNLLKHSVSMDRIAEVQA